jgi:cardiolipin synthase
MLTAVESAQKSVYLEMYIFLANTTTTHDFVGVFERKAREGVEVVLVLDAVGSVGLSGETVARLRAANVEVRFFRHIFHRTHRKLLIVDAQVAFLGGVNIAEDFRSWYDLQVAIEGTLVRLLLASFVRTYRFAGGTRELLVPKKLIRKKKQRVRAWLLDHVPFMRKGSLKPYYVRKISNACSAIDLVTPYFIPARWLEHALADAVSRGVHVRVLIPAKTNHKFLDVANAHYAARVAAAGVEVRMVGGMNHAKAMVIDRSEAMVGSANIDTLSFERNGELGVFFVDRDIVAAIEETIESWVSRSLVFHPTTHGLSWFGKLLVPVVRLFSGVL